MNILQHVPLNIVFKIQPIVFQNQNGLSVILKRAIRKGSNFVSLGLRLNEIISNCLFSDDIITSSERAKKFAL